MSTKPLAKQVVHGANGAESANAQDGAIRPRDSLFHWCGTADSLRQTPDRAAKRSLLDAYFGAVADESIGPAARLFSGVLVPRADTRSVVVPKPLIEGAIEDLTGIPGDKLRRRYVKEGDLGDAAALVFAGRLPSGLAITDVASWADSLAGATGADVQRTLLREMLARLSALEARYLVKLLCREMDIGVTDDLLEEALAGAFSLPVESVRRTNVARGDIGETATLARRRTLDVETVVPTPPRHPKTHVSKSRPNEAR
jgi:DNA ligase-1